jgi:DNA polymerase-3 subunit epsilon
MGRPQFPALHRRAVVVDVETADSFKHIIEIAAVEIVDGDIGRHSLVRRVRPATIQMNPFCYRVHGISLADVAHEPDFGDILPELVSFIGDDPILAHNRTYEMKSLGFECGRLGIPMPFGNDRFHCTMQMARSAGLSGKLREMCHGIGIAVDHLPETHDALSDVIMAGRLFVSLSRHGG